MQILLSTCLPICPWANTTSAVTADLSKGVRLQDRTCSTPKPQSLHDHFLRLELQGNGIALVDGSLHLNDRLLLQAAGLLICRPLANHRLIPRRCPCQHSIPHILQNTPATQEEVHSHKQTSEQARSMVPRPAAASTAQVEAPCDGSPEDKTRLIARQLQCPIQDCGSAPPSKK